ncbi:MAG: YqjK-like family protein [Gallionella sp.]|nr:YqjK-like family protein [Gallionella sp.]
MGKRSQEVMQRRQMLLARINVQREQLAEIGTRWQPAFQVADLTVLAVGFMRSHPVLVAGLAGLAVVRRRSLAGLARGAGRVWRAWCYVNEFSKKITR